MFLKNRDILAISSIKGIGPSALNKISDSDYAKSGDDVAAPAIVVEALRDPMRRADIYSYADSQIDFAEREEVLIITRVDGRYPEILRRRTDSPAILYVKGNSELLGSRQVGIIGTRQPTAHGKIATQRVTAAFADQGFSILSGLALGCDAIAHEECVNRAGNAVAVLAHGLHTIAPKKNSALAKAIIDTGGVLVSEFPLGVEPQPHFFVQRDKTQAALSEAIIMMQSDLKGGSLHASRAAIKFARPLIVPYPTATDVSEGAEKISANLLLADGDLAEKERLLHCKREDLSNLIILHDRRDYVRIFQSLDERRSPVQNTLL